MGRYWLFTGWLGQLRPGSIGNAEFSTVFMTLAASLWYERFWGH